MTPQQLLDGIHTTGILTATWNQPTKKDRVTQIRLYRAQLREVKSDLKIVQDPIKKRYDGRNSFEASQESSQLLPYEVIEKLIRQFETYLARIEAGEEIELEELGNTFYGSYEKEFWIIGSELDAQKYELKNQLEKLASSIRFLTTTLKSKISDYNSKRLLWLGTLWAIIGSTIFVVAVVTLPTYFEPDDVTIYVVVGLGAFLFFYGLACIYMYRTNRNNLRNSIIELKNNLRQAKLGYVTAKKVFDEL